MASAMARNSANTCIAIVLYKSLYGYSYSTVTCTDYEGFGAGYQNMLLQVTEWQKVGSESLHRYND